MGQYKKVTSNDFIFDVSIDTCMHTCESICSTIQFLKQRCPWIIAINAFVQVHWYRTALPLISRNPFIPIYYKPLTFLCFYRCEVNNIHFHWGVAGPCNLKGMTGNRLMISRTYQSWKPKLASICLIQQHIFTSCFRRPCKTSRKSLSPSYLESDYVRIYSPSAWVHDIFMDKFNGDEVIGGHSNAPGEHWSL